MKFLKALLVQKHPVTAAAFSALRLASISLAAPDPNWLDHDRDRPAPPVVDAGTSSTEEQAGRPPSDATVLFDGKDFSQWVSMDGSPTKWIMGNGYMECVKGSGYVRTLQNFGDCQLHVEWATPTPPHGEGQGRGNSGVFFGMGRYEVQVLDSYENKTYSDGSAAAIYGQYPPLVNASRPPGQWQTYDIIYTAPRFDRGWQIDFTGPPDCFSQRRSGSKQRRTRWPDELAGARAVHAASGKNSHRSSRPRQSRALPQCLGA